MTCWNDSGSSRSPSPVEPTTSEKTIVTVLRTRAAAAGSRLSLRASTGRSYGTWADGGRARRRYGTKGFRASRRQLGHMRRFNGQPLLSPSDLNILLECRHLMALEIARFNGNGVPRSGRGAHVDILARYGEQHESAILDAYEASGRSVERIVSGRREDQFRAALDQTLAAMRRGVDVIHQATLVGDGFGGYADFLERVPAPSGLGDWSYEVADAKLARATKGYFLVQLSVYAMLLERIQDLEPQELAVLLGDGRRDTYRTEDFAAYVRRIRRYAEDAIAGGLADTYPLPRGHCGICDYRHHCEGRRRVDDPLSLVAGMRRDQVTRLELDGVPTLAALARLDPIGASRGSPATRSQSCGGRRRSSSASARPASSATSCSHTSPGSDSASCRSPRRATSSSTSKATPTSAIAGSCTSSASDGRTAPRSATRRSGHTHGTRRRSRSSS